MSVFSDRLRQVRLRYARTLAGLFVLTCAALAVKPLVLNSSWREIFSGGYVKEYLVVWKLLDETYDKASPVLPVRGSRVELLGQTIGAVEEIFLGDPSGKQLMRNKADHLVFRLKVKGNFAELAEEASEVRLREDFGGYGSAFFELALPKPGEKRKQPIRSNVLTLDDRERSVRLTMEKSLPDLMVNLSAISKDLKTLVDNANKFTEEKGELRQILRRVNESMPDKDQKGLAALLLDPKDAQSLTELMANLKLMTRQLSDSGSKTSLPAVITSLTRTLKRYEDMVASVEKTMDSYTDTSESLQKTWLLRKHADQIEKERQESSTGPSGSAPADNTEDKKKRLPSTRRN